MWSVCSSSSSSAGAARPPRTSSLLHVLHGDAHLEPRAADLGKEHRFEVPNRVIRELGWEHFAGLLKDLEGIDLHAHPMTAAQQQMLAAGDIAAFLHVFHEDVVKAMGVKDLRQFSEKALKMMLLTCVVMTGIFNVLSEREFAQGYCDLFLTPARGARDAKYAWMLEIGAPPGRRRKRRRSPTRSPRPAPSSRATRRTRRSCPR